jgi:hypothetical protein
MKLKKVRRVGNWDLWCCLEGLLVFLVQHNKDYVHLMYTLCTPYA